MGKSIISTNGEMPINKEQVVKKNNTIVATYYALYAENKHLSKALYSITLGDERISTLKEYRSKLLKKIKSILRRKAYRGQPIAYFSNIELGKDEGNLTKDFNPHLHIQFFFQSFKPIEEAINALEKEFKPSNTHTATQTKPDADYDYVIKEYKADNYNEAYEINKRNLYYRQTLYSCSRKSVSNYVIKYLYRYLSRNLAKVWNKLETYERYDFILRNIKEGHISITTKKERPSTRYRIYKNSALLIDLRNCA